MAKILLVDDEIEILNPLQEMLEEEGFKVRAFTNPIQSLNLMRVQSFDLAIFDSGCRNVVLIFPARLEINPSLPIIFLSSKWSRGPISRFFAWGRWLHRKLFTNLWFRVKSVLKRHALRSGDWKTCEVGDLIIDLDVIAALESVNIDLTVLVFAHDLPFRRLTL